MKLTYYPQTDTLYIRFSDQKSIDTRQVSPAVAMDFDAEGQLVGINVYHASKVGDLARLEAEGLPITTMTLTTMTLQAQQP